MFTKMKNIYLLGLFFFEGLKDFLHRNNEKSDP